MTGGLICAGIVLLFVIIFALPIGLDIRYRTTISGAVTLAGIPLVRFPENRPQKPKKAHKKKEKSAEKSKKDKGNAKPNPIKKLYQQEGISGILDFIGHITKILGELMARLGRKFCMKVCDIHITVGGADPAATAVAYGKMCAGFYPAIGALFSLMRYKKYHVDVTADYFRKHTEAQARIVCQISIGAILFAVLRAGFSFLKLLIKTKRKEAISCQTKMHKV